MYATNYSRFNVITDYVIMLLGALPAQGQIFLLVDLRDFFSDLGSGGRKKKKKL